LRPSRNPHPRYSSRAWKLAFARRYAIDRLFRLAGTFRAVFSALVLAFLLASMTANGVSGFKRSELRMAVPIRGSMQIGAQRLGQPDPPADWNWPGCPVIDTPPTPLSAKAAHACWRTMPGARSPTC
jgi:phosphate transport system permease protein